MGTGSEAKLDFGDVGVEMQLVSPVIFKQEYHHQHHHHHQHQHHPSSSSSSSSSSNININQYIFAFILKCTILRWWRCHVNPEVHAVKLLGHLPCSEKWRWVMGPNYFWARLLWWLLLLLLLLSLLVVVVVVGCCFVTAVAHFEASFTSWSHEHAEPAKVIVYIYVYICKCTFSFCMDFSLEWTC